MAGKTRLQLRTTARKRADMENDNFVDDDEWNDYIDDAASELHDLVIQARPDYKRKKVTIPLVNGEEEYGLPTDFYKVLAVYYNRTGSDRLLMDRLLLHDLALQSSDLLHRGTRPRKYDILELKLVVFPKPTAQDESIEFWYTPQYERLQTDNQKIDYPVVNGWEDYITVTAAIQALAKEESDTTALERRQQSLARRITRLAEGKDAYSAKRIRDVYQSTRRFRRQFL